MEKLTEEFVKKQFKNKGYNLISKYKNNQTPVLVEKEGYKAYIQYSNFYMGKNPSFFGLINPFLEDNIKLFISKKDSEITVLKINTVVKSKRKRILVTIKCSCGEIYSRIWDSIFGGEYVKCNKCSVSLRGKNHRKDKTLALQLFKNRGYKILESTDNFTRNKPIEVENKEGYRGFISYNRLLSNRNIAIFELRTNAKNYIYNINNYAKQQGVGTVAIGFADNQKWTTRGIKFKCSCGKEYETSINSFQSGKFSCDECSKASSRYERIIKSFLDKNNISYIFQFRINSCRDVLPLPFDFFIEKNKGLIEVDGEGHYFPCHFNQIGHEDSIKTFEYTVKHDKIKDEYCERYNIPLLRISYKEILNNTYKEKIMQFIEN